jgi:hypothetical protein
MQAVRVNPHDDRGVFLARAWREGDQVRVRVARSDHPATRWLDDLVTADSQEVIAVLRRFLEDISHDPPSGD